MVSYVHALILDTEHVAKDFKNNRVVLSFEEIDVVANNPFLIIQ